MGSNYPHPFHDLKAQFTKLYRDLPVLVSNLAMNEFKSNIRQGGYKTKNGTIKWKKRKDKTRRDEKRPLLVKSGRLKRAFSTRPTFGRAAVRNNTPYAQVQNEGFNGTQNVGSYKRAVHSYNKVGTGVYSVKNKRERQRTEKHVSGYKEVKAHTRKMNLPARPFMITTDLLIDKINELTEKKLDKIFK